eukprot:2054031-Rhodomonas_salina.1
MRLQEAKTTNEKAILFVSFTVLIRGRDVWCMGGASWNDGRGSDWAGRQEVGFPVQCCRIVSRLECLGTLHVLCMTGWRVCVR